MRRRMEHALSTAEMTTVEVESPTAWSALLGDPMRLMEVPSLGMEEYRLRQAILLYCNGGVSLASAAEQARLPLRVVQEKARQRGLLPRSDSALFDQDLQA